MTSKKPVIALFAVIILAAVLFAVTSLTGSHLTENGATKISPTNTQADIFSSPSPDAVPSTSEASGFAATSYQPVFPVNIGSEGVKTAVSLHHNVPENLRAAYVQMLDALKEHQKDINLTKAESEDDFQRALIYVRDFNPELFFVDWSLYNYKATASKNVTQINFNFIDDDVKEKAISLENEVQKIVEQANRYPNAFERELFVHDYLVNNTVYTVDTPYCGSAYGALVEHKARCEGYARAFQMIMLRLGIPAYSVIGTAENERHMWNAVELYGNYYFVDVTFDDNSAEEKLTALNEWEISHSCFNMPEEIISKTHIISPSGSTDKYGAYQNLFLPECNRYDFNYYRIRGLMAENTEQFKYILEKNSSQKRACVFFKGQMPSSASLQDAFGEFFENQYSSGGYSIYYTPETSPVYKRNVYEISWTID